jgi:hypothetical protein
MAQTLPDITANSDDWVSVNTLTSIPVGGYMTIANKSSRQVLLSESNTKPTAASISGIVLSPLSGKEPSGIVPEGSLEIWAKGLGGKAVLTVQQSSIVTSGVTPVEVSTRGSRGVPTFVLDQTTNPLAVELLQGRTTTSLAVNADKGDTIVTLTGGHGAVAGDTLEMASATIQDLFVQAKITDVNVDIITVDQPMNTDYLTTDIAIISTGNMLVNGSLASPELFTILPLPTQEGDIVRIVLDLRGTGDMDFSTFGSDDALTNGCVVRVKQADGNFRNLFNFKSNGDFIRQAFDHRFLFPRKVGNTIKGFTSRLTWGGQSKHGVVIRLDGSLGEELQVLVQDDLVTGSANTVFTMVAQGHEVQGQ